MIKLQVGEILGHETPSPEEVKEIKRNFIEVILPKLDSMLEGKKYLCTGEVFSAIDILYYNEFGCFITLYPTD